ncbi:MAG: nucleotidyltransferase [Candidatus Paceibacterota bacterium]|jgi:hypothetical protein
MISKEQLEMWASAPSPTEMEKIRNARTVIENIIKRRLPTEEIKKNYALDNFEYEIYLQGSYANSTNVRFDSDVDIVVQLNKPFFSDKSQLSELERNIFDSGHKDTPYEFKNFKEDILSTLSQELPSQQIVNSDKCIKIEENTNRVKADVVACIQYRVYKKYLSFLDEDSFVEGIKFFNTSNNLEIINYPKTHINNCESKNKDTEGKFKDMIRIYKNMRNKLIEEKVFDDKTAPSYFIENLLYNCSSPCFDGSYNDCMVKILQFVIDAIESGRITGFVCANEQDTLISQKTWNLQDLILFINKTANYYIGENV